MPPPAPPAREGKEDNGDIPPAFSEELTLREMKASFKSNKGALTCLSNQVKVRVLCFYVGSTLLLSFLCVMCAILAMLCFLFTV